MLKIKNQKIRIFSDIDDTLLSFFNAYKYKFRNTKDYLKDKVITRNVQQVLRYDKEFWINLERLRTTDIELDGYCTKRVNNKDWTRQSLIKNKFPNRPIYQQICYCKSKAPLIVGRCDLMIEDSLANFIDLNLKGIPCLLIDSPYNKSWGPIGRIYTLNEYEVYTAYKSFKDNIFNNFKKLL